MPKPILPDAKAFEFVTSLGKRLDLHGALISWSDKLSIGLAEHQILKRDGAIHQTLGAKPRIFSFTCVLLGKDLTKRYQTLTDTLEQDPMGTLTHPRFGSLSAVFQAISAEERPAEALNTIRFTLEFARTGLRSVEQQSPETFAAAAMEVLTVLSTDSQMSRFQTLLPGRLAQLQSSALAYQQKANQFAQGQATLPELSQVLGAVSARVDALRAIPALEYRIKAQAALVFSNILSSYNASQSSRPPAIFFSVPGNMSIQRLCASLYGGKHARAMVQEVMSLNRIPNPYHIPAGTRLLLSDPTTVKTYAR